MTNYFIWTFIVLNALAIFLMVYGISSGWVDDIWFKK